MANLYPTSTATTTAVVNTSTENFVQKKTYAIDLETMKFIKNPDGTVKLLNEFESYIQWCELAMLTVRNKYMAYSSKFGRDSTRVSSDKDLIELEEKRLTIEALMAHPLTTKVDNFVFTWEDDDLYFSYNVTSSFGSITLQSKKIEG